MTGYYVCAGDSHRDLWVAATYDSSMALTWIRPGGHGRLFTDSLEELLLGASVIQPTIIESPRQVTRGDIPRLEVALKATRFDLAVMNAERLSAWDGHLLNLCAARAGVDVYLICEVEPQGPLAAWAGSTLSRQDSEAMLDHMANRPSAEGRRHTWACAKAVAIGAGAAPRCEQHVSAAACVLTWAPHAVATVRLSPPALRARLHELARQDDESRWPIWTRARDTYRGAQQAAGAAGLTRAQLKSVRVGDLSRDGRTLRMDGRSLALPEGPASVIRARRDIKVAEGLGREAGLFAVQDARVAEYSAFRSGDPAGSAPIPPAKRRTSS